MNSKLLAVTRHEFLTVVKQPSFWMSMLVIPAIMAVIFAISYFSNAQEDTETKKNQSYTIAVVDQSGLISPTIAKAANLKLVKTNNPNALLQDVKDAKLDGLIVYPTDVVKDKSYRVYANDSENKFNTASDISGLGNYLLRQSLLAPLGSPQKIDVALNGAEAQTTTYQQGEESAGFAAYIVPGFFLILFYIVLLMTISYAMTSVSEEKENRAIEMVLSYVRPNTLITGKLLGIILVTLTQFLFYLAIAAVGLTIALILNADIGLPFKLSELVFEPQPIIFGALYLITGFLLYVALMLATGAAFPSAKEAGSFSTVFYLLPFVPMWGLYTILSTPESLFAQFATYFPLTAPSTLLLRNTLGSLTLVESLIGLTILVTSTLVAIWLAGRLFKLGALEFNSSVKLRKLFRS